MEIEWDDVEQQANLTYLSDDYKHVIDENDFIDGFKAGYKACWEESR
jgi:hypothetical protein